MSSTKPAIDRVMEIVSDIKAIERDLDRIQRGPNRRLWVGQFLSCEEIEYVDADILIPSLELALKTKRDSLERAIQGGNGE